MENNEKRYLRISGSGSSGGGIFDEVKISGSGRIEGDVECILFKTSGSSDVRGNVKSEFFKTSGSSNVKGNLESEEIKVSGSCHVQGNVKTESISISGSTHIKGNINAQDIEVSGSVKVEDDCEAERFRARGGFEIGGLLNADTIDIGLGGRCSVKEIGGGKIEVREGIMDPLGLGRLVKHIFNMSDKLTVDCIEGDDIYLESTVAKVVRGNNIVIGRNCDIQTVEYKESLNIDDNAKVIDQIKL